jgi:hypothetical protein
MKRLVPVVGIVTILLTGPASATSFFPYRECCVADLNGRYYVVVKVKDPAKDERAVTLTIAERRPGTPAVQSAEARDNETSPIGGTVRDPAIRVRDGDTVHGRIVLDQPPGIILVAANGNAVVTVDKYGFNNLGAEPGKNDVVIYSLKGDVVHRKSRDELFDETARRYFHYIDGCVAWQACAWLDEKRDRIVIVGPGDNTLKPPRLVFGVGISSGEVHRVGFEAIEQAITDRNDAALSDALDLAYGLRLTGSRAGLPALAEDDSVALGVRLRAAVLLASLGDKREAPLVNRIALRATVARAGDVDDRTYDDVGYAIRHLPELTGDDALPVLLKGLRTSGRDYTFAFYHAFHTLGAKAVPELIKILEDDLNFDAQLEAATCLGYLGPEAAPAVPALIRALHKKTSKKWGLLDLRLDGHAAWALEHIGPKARAAIPDLEKMAREDNESTVYFARRALEAIRKQPNSP